MLITAPFIPIFYIIIGINTEKEATRQMLSLNRFSNYFLNVMKGIMTIKAFDYEEKALNQTAKYSEQYKEHTMKILKTAFLSTLIFGIYYDAVNWYHRFRNWSVITCLS